MIFVNEDYTNYKYLVEVSDNYIVLTNSSNVNGEWQNPDTINVIYQFIKPSTLTIEGTRTYTSTQSFNRVEVSDDYWTRGDVPEILSISLMVTFLFVFILNGLTRILKKGGIFFGN